MWPVALSGRLPVVALVGHYPTNKLIGREPIPDRKTFHQPSCEGWSYPVLDPVSQAYPEIRGRLLTCYSPVRHSSTQSKLRASAFDLHVLSTQPAFVLSQDQTLHKKIMLRMNPSKTADRHGVTDRLIKKYPDQTHSPHKTVGGSAKNHPPGVKYCSLR